SYVHPDDHIKATTRAWRDLAAEQGMEQLFDACLEWLFSAAYRSKSDGEIDRLKAIYRLTHQDVTSFRGQSLAGVRHDSSVWIGQITCPTLIVHGAEDRLVDRSHADSLAARIAHAKLSVIDDAPHFLAWELAPRFNDEIIGFLRA